METSNTILMTMDGREISIPSFGWAEITLSDTDVYKDMPTVSLADESSFEISVDLPEMPKFIKLISIHHRTKSGRIKKKQVSRIKKECKLMCALLGY